MSYSSDATLTIVPASIGSAHVEPVLNHVHTGLAIEPKPDPDPKPSPNPNPDPDPNNNSNKQGTSGQNKSPLAHTGDASINSLFAAFICALVGLVVLLLVLKKHAFHHA